MIRVDTNPGETKVFECLRASLGDDQVARQRLDVGDIAIQTNDMSIILERKRWADLEASILDGRFKEQKDRFLPADGVRYAYIIEGQLEGWDGKARALPRRNLWAALVKTCLRDSILIFHTKTEKDTASLVEYVARQLRDGGLQVSDSLGVARGTAKTKRKRDNLNDPRQVFESMLCVIPGMSLTKASSVADVYPNVASLMTASQKCLSDVPVGNRRLGPKMAEAIRGVFAARSIASVENVGASSKEDGDVPPSGAPSCGAHSTRGDGDSSDERS